MKTNDVRDAQDVIRTVAAQMMGLSSSARMIESAAYNVLVDALLYLDGQPIQPGRFVDRVAQLAGQ